ncbi:nickel-responsive transcriptional regulator NikR [Sedimentisphaera salicampi]|uniref:Putative nickel-responsive regulator n=1 Tax=Sedimentisphaera salicampi TaxID=1941349 RepID=A0A1W6LL78_9BACT|nr:nickel-responsive transcriptional regulator NikR [Sedimentisphaera salicampi]ARN56502.1 Putative nickel-responsive regulator [Sedimentisphaera salicampi]OXU15385.1 putative nickel-responsive regulator [Sedimentisphaera salicampi]
MDIERIGVSIEESLLNEFDSLIKASGAKNRSEAVRDLIRQKLAEEKLTKPDKRAVGCITLIYDHHKSALAQKLTDLQHHHIMEVIASTHVHLSHSSCMEVIITKGEAENIKLLSEQLAAQKGVKLSKFTLMPEEDAV